MNTLSLMVVTVLYAESNFLLCLTNLVDVSLGRGWDPVFRDACALESLQIYDKQFSWPSIEMPLQHSSFKYFYLETPSLLWNENSSEYICSVLLLFKTMDLSRLKHMSKEEQHHVLLRLNNLNIAMQIIFRR